MVKITATAYIDLDVIGNSSEVMLMLQHLDSCFSEAGMENFLVGRIGPYLSMRAKKRFANEGDDAVGKWAPLKKTTRLIRSAGITSGEWPLISPSHPINKRTGDMEKYITQSSGDLVSTRGLSTLYYPVKTTNRRNSLPEKIRRAQFGDSRTVARPVLGVGYSDLSYVVTELAMFIKTGV